MSNRYVIKNWEVIEDLIMMSEIQIRKTKKTKKYICKKYFEKFHKCSLTKRYLIVSWDIFS